MLIYSNNSLTRLFQDFYNVTRLQICVFDEQYTLVDYFHNDKVTFCNSLSKNTSAKQLCEECDRKAFETCKRTGKHYQYQCHCGLLEGVVPIKDEKGGVVAFVMIGQTRPSESCQNNPLWLYKEYGLDAKEFSKLYQSTSVVSAERFDSMLNLLDILVKQIEISTVNEYKDSTIMNNLEAFLNHSYADDINVEYLCNRFYISKSKLYKLFHQAFGTTVSAYIKKIRLDRACNLLKNTSLPISVIAQRVGFSDYNYFTKVVVAHTKLTPTAYRLAYAEK